MFFKEWIQKEDELIVNNCNILKLTEIPESRDKVYENLIETIINNYSNPKRIKKYLREEKYSKLETYINKRITTNPIYQKGDFGEIFGAEHLKQHHDYIFPITKLRLKLKVNRSLEGEDILGFYLEDGKITKICIGESKVRSNHDSNAISDAIDQLKKSYNPHPVLLKYFSDYIYETNEEELSEKIEDLMSIENFNKIKKDNWIFLISGFNPKEFKIKPNDLDNLVLINVYFEDLNEFITTLFNDCRSYYHEK